MDYFGAPHIKTYLPPNSWPIDMINAAAALPGDGEAQMTFTYSFDVAQFVVKSLDLPRWDEEMRIVGDTVKLNDFLKMAEEARGKFRTISMTTKADYEARTRGMWKLNTH